MRTWSIVGLLGFTLSGCIQFEPREPGPSPEPRQTTVEPCSSGFVRCTGYCSNPRLDNNNCGACGSICSETEICRNGVCTAEGGNPAPRPSPVACGDRTCNGAETCTSCPTDCGRCSSSAPRCEPGFADCDGNGSCESDTNSGLYTCGGCNAPYCTGICFFGDCIER